MRRETRGETWERKTHHSESGDDNRPPLWARRQRQETNFVTETPSDRFFVFAKPEMARREWIAPEKVFDRLIAIGSPGMIN